MSHSHSSTDRDRLRDSGFARKQAGTRTILHAFLNSLLRVIVYGIFLAGMGIFLFIGIKGIQSITTDQFPFVDTVFFTQKPEALFIVEDSDGEKRVLNRREYLGYQNSPVDTGEMASVEVLSYAGGGILPAIAGSFFLVTGSLLISLGLGISAAIYLSEYSRESRWLAIVRLAVLNLAGVPSILYGLFGFAFFVLFFGWGQSLLAGWFTLAMLALPLIIRASEDALRAVPSSFREASLALGATRWQTIHRIVLPQALSGILTASLLSLVRVAGETAPLLFTVALAYRATLPWEVGGLGEFVLQGVMALPYHLYIVSTRLPIQEATERAQFGTAFVFLSMICLVTAFAIYFRARARLGFTRDDLG